jgi:hypothetical protein
MLMNTRKGIETIFSKYYIDSIVSIFFFFNPRKGTFLYLIEYNLS